MIYAYMRIALKGDVECFLVLLDGLLSRACRGRSQLVRPSFGRK